MDLNAFYWIEQWAENALVEFVGLSNITIANNSNTDDAHIKDKDTFMESNEWNLMNETK
ncbi:hypothetical protein HPP92_020884 [Vanilla planifolia]|uniref:Uncharacterized protein n=1 Tax=Vanilla planifolia TaxID=51239 RepID=A0A835Q354_VANPL|nr:hypothetical protein HPP92_020884 [Vanilla planifolia]